MSTVLLLRDDDRYPHAAVVLNSGDHIKITIDRGGMTISHVAPGNPKILFLADADLVSRLCAGLIEKPKTFAASPLRIIVAAVLQLPSADEVEKAFRQIAAEIR